MLTHISYSSIKDASECPYRFKLRSIDKIRLFPNNIHSIFGTVMHNAIQAHLLQEQDQALTAKRFHRTWRTFCRLYRKHLDFEQVSQFLRAGLNIIAHINEAFQGYSVIASEQEIGVPIAERAPSIPFKGYIDLLMDHNERTVIADLKTAKNIKSFKSYLTPIKRYQLAYYRKYFARQFEMDEREIDLLYIVLEKDPTSKEPIQMVPVKFTPKKIAAADTVIDSVLDMVDKNEFPKNRKECFNEWTGIRCAFYQTEHCT